MFFVLLFTNDNVILKVNVAIFRESYLAVVVDKVSETSSRFITHFLKVFLGNVDRLVNFDEESDGVCTHDVGNGLSFEELLTVNFDCTVHETFTDDPSPFVVNFLDEFVVVLDSLRKGDSVTGLINKAFTKTLLDEGDNIRDGVTGLGREHRSESVPEFLDVVGIGFAIMSVVE